MSGQSVEPMSKPTRERDFDRAESKKARRFKSRNVENGKREYFFQAATATEPNE